MAKKPNWMIVYEALAVGQQVKFPNHPYTYALDIEGRLCYVFSDGKGIGCDITLNGFIKLCEKLTFDECFILSAQTTLMKEAQKKGEKRGKQVQELSPAPTDT